MKVLHRARHLYSDEYFTSESIKFEFNQMYLSVKGKWRECEQDTRSINLSNMIDSEGTKIFASLSKDGKGGDIVDLGYNRLTNVMQLNKSLFTYSFEKSKVTGIKK